MLLTAVPYFHSELCNTSLNFKVHYDANALRLITSHYLSKVMRRLCEVLPIITSSCQPFYIRLSNQKRVKVTACDLQPNADGGVTEVQQVSGKVTKKTSVNGSKFVFRNTVGLPPSLILSSGLFPCGFLVQYSIILLISPKCASMINLIISSEKKPTVV